jgi:hypothetical protein
MVLENSTIKRICDFVKQKPRTIQEISQLIKKNWRTAERYVEKIEQETGCISCRVFRKGTRGALKVVYWNMVEDIHSTSFQTELLDNLIKGRSRADFSPFDIYQHISGRKKKIQVEEINKNTNLAEATDFINFLKKAEKQILIFSGNLSWVNSIQNGKKILDVVRGLTKKGVSIKIVARVSLVGGENAKKLMVINKEPGRDMIEIKHRYHPLRGMIIDNKIAKLREKKDPTFYKEGELKKPIEVFYDIYDKEWIDWLQKVFWKMFSTSLPVEKRLEEVEKIKEKVSIHFLD